MGCGSRSCRKTFHLPCALESGALPQFCGNFSVFCLEHRPSQDCGPVEEGSTSTCGICLDEIRLGGDEASAGDGDGGGGGGGGGGAAPAGTWRLWAPCCGGWFHRECLCRLAKSTGYFFKCPLCNNKEEFEREMKNFGVYIPDQDAAWEMDDGAFVSLLERHDSCDAEVCRCPDGRKKDVDDTIWEIVSAFFFQILLA